METTASEIMSTELLTAREGMTIEEALKLLINSRITGMPVVDKNGKMTGVISEYDILQQISKMSKKGSPKNRAEVIKPEIFKRPIVFSKKADSVGVNTPLHEIIDLFIASKYRRLPVVDVKGKLVGIITRRDLMRVFYYRAKLL